MSSTLSSDLKSGALVYHAEPKPGKLEIRATKPLGNQRDMALAYSPGVAAVSQAIADDPALKARAAGIAARTYEFAEFLLHVVGFNRRDEGAPTTVALHTSCSARREMGTLLVGRELLARLGNVRLAIHDHESECCGFGGSFSLKHPDISTAMVGDKLASLKATGAKQMVTADCGCMLNITKHAAKEDLDAGRTAPSLPGEHLATFLLRRTGGKQS